MGRPGPGAASGSLRGHGRPGAGLAALEGRTTIRSFASTIAGNGSRTGIAVLVPIGAALLAAAALLEIRQVLLALADPACAACVDARNIMGGAAAAAGTAGAGAAGAGAAGSGDTDRGRRSGRLPGPEDDVGDATSPNQQLEGAREGITRPGGLMLDVSRQIDRWAHAVMGEDIIGTVPSGGKA